MNEAKKCTCGAEMKSRGVQHLSISNSRLFADSILMQEDVEVFVCPKCRRMEFYSAEVGLVQPFDDENTPEQRLYDMYKNEPADKLRKILDSGSYTDECKSVIRKILSER